MSTSHPARCSWGAVPLAAFCLLLGSGCASGGKQWLESQAVDTTGTTSPSRASSQERSHWPAAETPVGKPRISRVVSLGETYQVDQDGKGLVASTAPRRLSPDSTYRSYRSGYGYGYGYGYGGYGYLRELGYSPYAGWGHVWTPTKQKEESSLPPIAGDWPAVPNYGPRFPYAAAPADPWQ